MPTNLKGMATNDPEICALQRIHNVKATKDWIAKHQITAEVWFVANPNLTVAGTRRLERNGKALDEFLDKISA